MVASERDMSGTKRLPPVERTRPEAAYPILASWRVASHRRLVTATCASLLLHALLLAVYDQRKSADEGLPTATWSRDLGVTLHLPQSSHFVSNEDMLEKTQTKDNARLSRNDPVEQIDDDKESTSIPSKTVIPMSSSGTSASRNELDSSPAVDIDAARQIARQMARAKDQNPNQQLPRRVASDIERETPLAQAIARSARSDCRTAYAGAGLFAIPLLIRDAVTDSGCKW